VANLTYVFNHITTVCYNHALIFQVIGYVKQNNLSVKIIHSASIVHEGVMAFLIVQKHILTKSIVVSVDQFNIGSHST